MVTNGVYGRIWHAMYSAMFLQGIRSAPVLPNALVGPAWLVSCGLLYLLRVSREEAMFRDRLGGVYTAHMFRTGRWLPRI